ncbi:hypothetical protein F5Y03DRAFT_399373 [Xylaria venustula]|nr:hypothetical protein F5Y03DRAFT_399373 [Xylaria venustula]
MTAVAVHQIAVQLFKSETSLHENDEYMVNWKEEDENRIGIGSETTMPPTLFRHLYYDDYEQYPDGIADRLGYWAENRLFGGVILSDRRAPGSSPNMNNNLEVDHPRQTKKRIDPEERIVDTDVYRDTWERKDLGKEEFYTINKMGFSVVDYPTDDDANKGSDAGGREGPGFMA